MCSSRVQEFLDGEKRNNQEKEKKLGVLERDAAKTRLTYQDAETARIAFKDEVHTYYTLAANAYSLTVYLVWTPHSSLHCSLISIATIRILYVCLPILHYLLFLPFTLYTH